MGKKHFRKAMRTLTPFMLLFTIGNGLTIADKSDNDDAAPNGYHIPESLLGKMVMPNQKDARTDKQDNEELKTNEIPKLIRIMMELYESKLSYRCQIHEISDNTSHKSQLKLSNLTKTQYNKIIALIAEMNDNMVHWDELASQIESILGNDGMRIVDDRLMRISKLFHIDIPLEDLTIDQKDTVLIRVQDLKNQGISLEEIRGEIKGLLDESWMNQHPIQYLTCC